MKIYLSPQVSTSGDRIQYSFDKDVVKVEYKGKKDVFNFLAMPDGVAENITSELSFCPIISAKRVNGELMVELLNQIDINATESEKFPKWIDYKEYKEPSPPKRGEK